MPLIEYEDASPEVRAVYDDIMETRQVDWVNNFWKALAFDPVTLRRTWESVKEVMAPGALDPLTKELLYVAVSVTNGCEYCIASHTAAARKKGMSEEQLAELLAVVGMANETNALATGYGVPVDDAFCERRQHQIQRRTRRKPMSFGPIEYLIVGFPGNKFKGEIVPALAELVENGTIRILDLVFIAKDEEGNVAAVELAELDPEDEAAAMSDISEVDAAS